jgi:hypothetical protein
MDGLNSETVDKLAVQHLGQAFEYGPERCRWLAPILSNSLCMKKICGGYFYLLNTRTNSFEGICEEPNGRLKLQKSRINMAGCSAIGSNQNSHR